MTSFRHVHVKSAVVTQTEETFPWSYGDGGDAIGRYDLKQSECIKVAERKHEKTLSLSLRASVYYTDPYLQLLVI